jgi:hypothetical protein
MELMDIDNVKKLNLKSPRILFKQYLENFQSLINIKWGDDTKTWTNKNLGYFRELAKAKGYDSYPDPDKKEHRQYLFDLCWENQAEGKHRWLELALEEEWNENWNEVFWDFGKLTDVKAFMKVFICRQKEAERSELPVALAHYVSQNGIKLPEETYLVIMFSRNTRRKVSERLQIEGFAIDYRGELTELGSRLFSD